MSCGIYKITNLINNKVYIGQSVDIEERWKHHRSNINTTDTKKRNLYIYQAMRKYGIENFEFSILEECDKSLLNEKEEYWIEYYHSHNKEFGYNLTDGGTNPPYTGKKINQYDLDGNYIRSFKSAAEAAREYNIIPATITNCCYGIKTNPTACGYLWRFDYQSPPQPYKRKANRYDIEQYDLNNNLIQTFPSLRQASLYIGVSDVTLRKYYKLSNEVQYGNFKYVRKERR